MSTPSWSGIRNSDTVSASGLPPRSASRTERDVDSLETWAGKGALFALLANESAPQNRGAAGTCSADGGCPSAAMTNMTATHASNRSQAALPPRRVLLGGTAALILPTAEFFSFTELL